MFFNVNAIQKRKEGNGERMIIVCSYTHTYLKLLFNTTEFLFKIYKHKKLRGCPPILLKADLGVSPS